MNRVIWSEHSKADLQSIYEYIYVDSKYFAELEVIRIKSSTKILKTFLKAGRIIPEINIDAFREIICGNYRIAYKILDEKNRSNYNCSSQCENI